MRRIRAFPLLFWLVSSAGSLVAGKEQGCVAPSGIPCYTLDVVTDEWNLTDVFHISYRGSVCQEALRSDGSAVVREERTNGIWPFGSSQRIGRLYLAPSDQVTSWNSRAGIYSVRPAIAQGDRPASHAILQNVVCEPPAPKSWGYKRGKTSQIAGVAAVEWIHKARNVEHRMWFAPALGCQAVKFQTIVWNSWNIPIYSDTSTVTAVTWGEPDGALFRTPAGYKQIEAPDLQYIKEWRHAEEDARRAGKKSFLIAGPPPDWISFGTLR